MKLVGVHFKDSNLSGANLKGSDLTNANLCGAKLAGANLEAVKAQYALFIGADLRGARFTQAFLQQTCFRKPTWSAPIFRGRPQHLDHRRDHCQAAVFTGANLTYCDFSHADLSGADLSNTTLFRTVLHRILEKNTNWQGADRGKALGTDTKRAKAEDWASQSKPEA